RRLPDESSNKDGRCQQKAGEGAEARPATRWPPVRNGRRLARGAVLQFREPLGYTRDLFIRMRDLFVSVCKSFVRARDQIIVGIGCCGGRHGVHGELRPMSTPSRVVPRSRRIAKVSTRS